MILDNSDIAGGPQFSAAVAAAAARGADFRIEPARAPPGAVAAPGGYELGACRRGYTALADEAAAEAGRGRTVYWACLQEVMFLERPLPFATLDGTGAEGGIARAGGPPFAPLVAFHHPLLFPHWFDDNGNGSSDDDNSLRARGGGGAELWLDRELARLGHSRAAHLHAGVLGSAFIATHKGMAALNGSLLAAQTANKVQAQLAERLVGAHFLAAAAPPLAHALQTLDDTAESGRFELGDYAGGALRQVETDSGSAAASRRYVTKMFRSGSPEWPGH